VGVGLKRLHGMLKLFTIQAHCREKKLKRRSIYPVSKCKTKAQSIKLSSYPTEGSFLKNENYLFL